MPVSGPALPCLGRSLGGHDVGRSRRVWRSAPLAGATVSVATPPLGVPRLWAIQKGLLVTIAGDLTCAQLVAAAESL
jgi:hypothetical protein